jgi:hypothetical protein
MKSGEAQTAGRRAVCTRSCEGSSVAQAARWAAPAGGGRQSRAPASKPRRSRDIAANLGANVAFVLDRLLIRLLKSSALTFRISLAQHISVAAFRLRSLSIASHRSESPIFQQSARRVRSCSRQAVPVSRSAERRAVSGRGAKRQAPGAPCWRSARRDPTVRTVAR